LLDLHFFSPSLLGSDSAAFKTGLGGRQGFAGRDGEEVRRCGGGGVTVLGLNFEACDEAVVTVGFEEEAAWAAASRRGWKRRRRRRVEPLDPRVRVPRTEGTWWIFTGAQ
jgi:hypothetical protein